MTADEWLKIETARQKIAALPEVLQHLLEVAAGSERTHLALVAPERPGRDVRVLDIKQHPPKAGLQSTDGQIRLLHDLGNIELQAMELAVRTLLEFPLAPKEFRHELAEIALEESKHFSMCLDGLEELGASWGVLPVSRSLWDAVSQDSQPSQGDFLGRIMLVHRYMEATGLDAGEKILTRLSGVKNAALVRSVVDTIVREEIGHVSFGSRWYRKVCEQNGVDPHIHFAKAYPEILRRVPRTEKPALRLRELAGFDAFENSFVVETLAATDFRNPRMD
jgi:uncharacterized ferritin-like protein (DUF455 family)